MPAPIIYHSTGIRLTDAINVRSVLDELFQAPAFDVQGIAC